MLVRRARLTTRVAVAAAQAARVILMARAALAWLTTFPVKPRTMLQVAAVVAMACAARAWAAAAWAVTALIAEAKARRTVWPVRALAAAVTVVVPSERVPIPLVRARVVAVL